MEPRRVVIVAEVFTDLPVSRLRKAEALAVYIKDPDGITCCNALEVAQIQVNVVEAPKKKRGSKK